MSSSLGCFPVLDTAFSPDQSLETLQTLKPCKEHCPTKLLFALIVLICLFVCTYREEIMFINDFPKMVAGAKGDCVPTAKEVLAALAAEAEVGDHIASQEAGVTQADGKQKGSRKRLISLVDDTDDSDVEISQPTQKTKPRRQTSFGTATGKPMLQSTIDGGVGSSAQVCSKGKSVPMKS
ncbi:unnamed protein product, partial [Brassica rapa subsp. trilocularis]